MRKHPTRSPEEVVEVVRDARLAFVLCARIALQLPRCQRSGCGLGRPHLSRQMARLDSQARLVAGAGTKATGIEKLRNLSSL
jgi:hypothetical protein